MPDTQGAPNHPQWLRWAFVGMSAVLSLVLGAATLSNFIGNRNLRDSMIRGQSAAIFHIVHKEALGNGPPRLDDLQTALEEGSELGLTYIRLVRVTDEVVEVGEGRIDGAPTPGEYIERDGLVLVQMVDVPPPLAGGPGPRGPDFGPPGSASFAPPDAPPDAPPGMGTKGGPPPRKTSGPDAAGGPPRPGRALLGPPIPGRVPQFFIEFEPTLALQLAARTKRDLAIGLSAIAVLWGAAALFWQLARRAAKTESELIKQRHLAALGEMSAVVAHELRNPLASLKGHAQLLLEQAETPKQERKAKRVVDEALRLQELSTGLLEFARTGAVDRQWLPVGSLVRDAAAGSVAEVRIDLEDAPQTWSVDGPRLRQVIINLLDNASHAAPDHPVEVRVRGAQTQLEIVVDDRGPGVPVELRESIFEPFRTGRTQGTGLGLAVSRRIVQLHEGTIVCDMNEHGGARFVVRIPAPSGES